MRTDDAGATSPPGRDAVEWYFGDLVGDVARESPVSRSRLLDALAELEATATRQPPGATAHHRGENEVVVEVPEDHWQVIVGDAALSELEAAATRLVHRRMAAALGVTPDQRVPVVRLGGEQRGGPDPITPD